MGQVRFEALVLSQSLPQPYNVDTIIIPILQMQKLRLRESNNLPWSAISTSVLSFR